jgi:hypothetical protein
VRLRNQRPTRLSHERDVGVKCRWNLGCLASQACTLGWCGCRDFTDAYRSYDQDEEHNRARAGLLPMPE